MCPPPPFPTPIIGLPAPLEGQLLSGVTKANGGEDAKAGRGGGQSSRNVWEKTHKPIKKVGGGLPHYSGVRISS